MERLIANRLKIAIFSIAFCVASVLQVSASVGTDNPSVTTYNFKTTNNAHFLPHQKEAIKTITEKTIFRVRELMPELAKTIQFTLNIVDWDLSTVRGVSGRADRANEIEIYLSSVQEGGLDQAIKDGLALTVLHELHHTVRGWTIYNNKFGQGIAIAAINEGLADVFSEIQSGQPPNDYSDTVDFDAWTKEIMSLPKDANYGEWMFALPDGRKAVGYRTGAYLVKKAMTSSGKDILELSKLSVKEIYELAGY